VFAKVKPITQFIGQNIIYFNQVDSSNHFAIELLKQKMANNGDVVLAEFQSAGKGQGKKLWESEAFKNLLFSIILKPVTKTSTDPFIINKTIALALQQYIAQILPKEKVEIKWPNDLLVNNKKICGILIENNFTGNVLNYSVIGIGLNVNQDFQNAKHIDASSLRDYKNTELDRTEILKNLLEHIEPLIIKALKNDTSAIKQDFDKALKGHQIVNLYEINQQTVPGIVKSCDDFGRLIVEIDGQDQAFIHGQIKQYIS
jgi:BirA family biotin operon repressor/biotin-[acetyl-CoA-carboxylase] ligase